MPNYVLEITYEIVGLINRRSISPELLGSNRRNASRVSSICKAVMEEFCSSVKLFSIRNVMVLDSIEGFTWLLFFLVSCFLIFAAFRVWMRGCISAGLWNRFRRLHFFHLWNRNFQFTVSRNSHWSKYWPMPSSNHAIDFESRTSAFQKFKGASFHFFSWPVAGVQRSRYLTFCSFYHLNSLTIIFPSSFGLAWIVWAWLRWARWFRWTSGLPRFPSPIVSMRQRNSKISARWFLRRRCSINRPTLG